MGTRWSTPLRVIIANFIFKTDWMALDRCHHLSTNAALQALLLRMKTAAQRFVGLPLAHLLCDFLELVVLWQRSTVILKPYPRSRSSRKEAKVDRGFYTAKGMNISFA